MNNQKDTQKTNTNTFEHKDVSDDKSLINRPASAGGPIYEFANKKTEKLVTALYLVSDCMDTDDALKGKLRLLGVELLSDIYKLSTLSPVEKHTFLSVAITHVYELLSFIEISYTIGFISEMNTTILKNEFSVLISDLKSQQEKDKHFTFTLDEKMFDLPNGRQGLPQERFNPIGQQSIKDMPAHAGKRTSFNTMSFMNNKSPLFTFQPKRTNSHISNLADRQGRTDKIISLIKDLPAMPAHAGQAGVSIKDISLAFTDCSEKTIQRELNSLVSKGQLKKTGAKRWSRYSII